MAATNGNGTPNDRTDSGTPKAELPEIGGKVNPVQPWQSTLSSNLTPVVDRIRHLYTKFGLRPYRVFLVHVQWPGRRIGEGAPIVLSRREILPTPRVLDMNATTHLLRSIGLSEEGGIVIDQISTKYTEDDLVGQTPDLNDPAQPRSDRVQTQFFYEIVENRPSDPQPVPRRYVPNSVPMLSRDVFQWKITLTKQDYNRSRDLTFDRNRN